MRGRGGLTAMNVLKGTKMMMTGKMMLLSAAGALTLLGGVAMAQTATAPATTAQTGSNVSSDKGAKPSPQARGVEQAALAASLVSYGRQERSPAALMLAAQMYRDVGGVEAARAKTSEGAAAPAAGGTKQDRAAPTPAALFTEAKTLAGADRALVAQIDRIAMQQSKGAVAGPQRHRDRVLARDTDTYSIAFRGGEPARVAALGDGDTDLDLFVYDQNGNLVCSDDDSTDQTVCGWTPAWSGNFRVRIRNLGGVYNAYTLMTN